MKLEEFNKTEFGGKGLPQGDTLINFENLEIEPTIIEYDGKETTRYLLKVSPKEEFFAPKTVMAGLKKAQLDGFKKARITRTGEHKDTRYTVIGL